MESTSKIHKLTLDLTYTNPPVNNYALTGRIRNLFDEELEEAMNVAFQQLNRSEKVYIDTCVIDLGNVDETDFSSLLTFRLQEELKAILQTLPTAASGRKIEQQNFTPEDILIYFLTTGRLPWYAASDVKADELFMQSLSEQQKTFTRTLLTLFTKNKQALYRFTLQFEKKTVVLFFKKIILLLSPKITSLTTAWLRIVQIKNNPQLRTEEILYTLGSFLSEAATSTIEKDDNLIIHSFIYTVILPSTFISEAQAELLKIALQENEISTINFVESIIISHIANMQQYASPVKSNPPEVTDSTSPDSNSHTENENISSISIENAGLVLLGPFFQHLFTYLALLEDNKFITSKKQEKAAQILHYLATDQTTIPEHLLPLCKILVGLPVHHPVGKKLKLTNKEKEICNDLFPAVMNNWDKMKNTSKEGFQQSFLQRNGTLTQEGEDWTLTVEKRGYDILLETIPWTYSMFRAPWSKCLLYVNWI